MKTRQTENRAPLTQPSSEKLLPLYHQSPHNVFNLKQALPSELRFDTHHALTELWLAGSFSGQMLFLSSSDSMWIILIVKAFDQITETTSRRLQRSVRPAAQTTLMRLILVFKVIKKSAVASFCADLSGGKIPHSQNYVIFF